VTRAAAASWPARWVLELAVQECRAPHVLPRLPSPGTAGGAR